MGMKGEKRKAGIIRISDEVADDRYVFRRFISPPVRGKIKTGQTLDIEGGPPG